jgi:von Willebrand factor type A domain
MGRHRSRLLATLVATLALVVAQPPIIASAANCTTAQLEPTLGEFMVSQGVGGVSGYTTLARGKETLVKVFLTLPPSGTCTVKSTDYIKITNASLTVSSGASANTLFTSFTGKPSLPATIQPSSPADPIFVVPSSNLAPTATDQRFTPTFTVTLTYERKSGTTVQTGQTKTITNNAKTFEQKTQALRVYVVPMGDKGQPFSTQYTATDQTIAQNAMQTLSRLYPTPVGVADLTDASGGLRYVVDTATMLDLRSIANAYVMSGGVTKFCGTSINFTAIKGLLAQFLLTHNTANPAASADRVLGVVSGNISWGTGDGVPGCADGMASVSSAESWIRLVADDTASSPPKPSRSGALAAMEISHTFGLAQTASYHSASIEADAGTDRAYNLSGRARIPFDHTALNFNNTGSPWNNDTTLLEPSHFAYLLCKFTPLGGTCSGGGTPGNIGTATGVNAGEKYVIAGTTDGIDGTPAHTKVIEPYYAVDTAETPESPESLLRLVQLDLSSPSPVLANFGVPWSPAVTHEDGIPSGVQTFYAAAPGFFAAGGAAEVRLVKVSDKTDDPLGPSAVKLYSSLKSDPPVINEISGGAIPPSGGTSTLFRSQITPRVPPTPDIVFLADTTGSMASAIANVRTNVATVMSQVTEAQPNARFAVASYKDKEFTCVGDAYMFKLEQAITDDPAAVQAAIDSWTASGGCDEPEAQLNALYRLGIGDDGVGLTPTPVGYRADSSRVIAWFGDAPGHDPSNLHSLQAAIDALKAKSIRVIAVNIGRLDSNSPPDSLTGNLPGCPTPPGCAGQATRIANDTGGVVRVNDASEVSEAILAGLQDLPATVRPSPDSGSCSSNLSLTFTPEEKTVTGGTTVDFTEHVTVAPSDPGTYTCRVFFKINGKIVQTRQGDSFVDDPAYIQDISVVVSNEQRPTVTVRATSSEPDLLLDLIYECTTFNFVAAVAVKPSEVVGAQATFTANVDTTNACAKFGGGGTLVPYVSDGWNRVGGTVQTETTSQPKVPTAAIYTPALGVGIGATGTLALRGSGEIAGMELPGTALTWSIRAPNGTTTSHGQGSNVDVPAPTPNGWVPGVWTVILTVTFEGRTATATRTFSTARPSPFGP